MVDQPKENELDEEKEATATSKEAKKLTAEEKQRAKDREKRRKLFLLYRAAQLARIKQPTYHTAAQRIGRKMPQLKLHAAYT